MTPLVLQAARQYGAHLAWTCRHRRRHLPPVHVPRGALLHLLGANDYELALDLGRLHACASWARIRARIAERRLKDALRAVAEECQGTRREECRA